MGPPSPSAQSVLGRRLLSTSGVPSPVGEAFAHGAHHQLITKAAQLFDPLLQLLDFLNISLDTCIQRLNQSTYPNMVAIQLRANAGGYQLRLPLHGWRGSRAAYTPRIVVEC
eukprot:Sspe_Gene.117978::Locus_110400_Transcript_1_1_Confidence_1.000_Length_367::g.117978::m.117978